MTRLKTGFKISFGFGIGGDRDGSKIPDRIAQANLDCIKREVAYYFGGYSLHKIEGGWINGVSRLVEEPGYVMEVVVVLPLHEVLKQAQRMRDFIKEVLNQEAIVLTITRLPFAEIA